METGSVRLGIIDDHTVVRSGIRLLLEKNGFEVIAEAASIAEALGWVVEPDIILADLVLPDARGPEIVEALRKRYAAAGLIALTMLDSASVVRQIIEAGAQGYVLKDAAADELIAAIRHVSEGRRYLQPTLGIALASAEAEAGHAAAPASPLSPREREVLHLIALGHTNAEIAQKLGVALRTIESHRASIHHKTGAQTRADLVRYAAQAGLFDVGSP